MPKIRSILGYMWAGAAVIVVFATFLGSGFFSRTLVAASGVKISPLYTGGEVVRSVDHGSYRALIHRPVFDALIGERKEGFIQVNWEPLAGLPPVIEESIDYTGDGKADFSVRIDTKTGKTMLTHINPQVTSIEESVKLDDGWVVRVQLKKD
ncbi:MAG TPA: hypothetical protein PLX02_05795 [Syntrophorhabdaceae bacterium]|nr:hypothetical protein [Syntrophorhabdaceae bacterium]HQM81118.1 hypothetical protein [Syntrophorhabdaceae bacterium]